MNEGRFEVYNLLRLLLSTIRLTSVKITAFTLSMRFTIYDCLCSCELVLGATSK